MIALQIYQSLMVHFNKEYVAHIRTKMCITQSVQQDIKKSIILYIACTISVVDLGGCTPPLKFYFEQDWSYRKLLEAVVQMECYLNVWAIKDENFLARRTSNLIQASIKRFKIASSVSLFTLKTAEIKIL